ncbi:MAG: Kelch repeat-containing protein [Bradymonadia bacterium]
MNKDFRLVCLVAAAIGLVGCAEEPAGETVVIGPFDASEAPGDMGDTARLDGQMGFDGGLGADADAVDARVGDPLVPGEKNACLSNESFAQLLPILNGGRAHPTGRGEQASAFDMCNRRIVLFGGNDFQPEECADFGPKRFQGDTWIYSLEHDNWARLNVVDGPSARGRHRMVFDQSRKLIYLFGGRFRAQANSGPYQLFNDFWAFDVNTDTWQQLETTGTIPSPRYNTAMVYDHLNDRVILFGGSTAVSGLEFRPQNDTYVLDLDTLVWRRVSGAAPQARLFHDMAIDSTHGQLLVYGGGGANAFTGPFFRDLWAFDLEAEVWSQIWDGSGRGPVGRINPVLVEDRDGGRMVMFAGHDDTNVGHRNDIWEYDYANRQWRGVVAGDDGVGAGCTRFCECPPDFVQVDINSPERRQYHTFQTIDDEGRAILFGGKGDCGYLDDTWSFEFATNEWTEIEPAGQGEACMRTGQEGCTDLCY